MLITLSYPEIFKPKVKEGLASVFELIGNQEFKIKFRNHIITPNKSFASFDLISRLRDKSLEEIISLLSSVEFLSEPPEVYKTDTIYMIYSCEREVKRFKQTFYDTCLSICIDYCADVLKIPLEYLEPHLKFELS